MKTNANGFLKMSIQLACSPPLNASNERVHTVTLRVHAQHIVVRCVPVYVVVSYHTNTLKTAIQLTRNVKIQCIMHDSLSQSVYKPIIQLYTNFFSFTTTSQIN